MATTEGVDEPFSFDPQVSGGQKISEFSKKFEENVKLLFTFFTGLTNKFPECRQIGVISDASNDLLLQTTLSLGRKNSYLRFSEAKSFSSGKGSKNTEYTYHKKPVNLASNKPKPIILKELRKLNRLRPPDIRHFA